MWSQMSKNACSIASGPHVTERTVSELLHRTYPCLAPEENADENLTGYRRLKNLTQAVVMFTGSGQSKAAMPELAARCKLYPDTRRCSAQSLRITAQKHVVPFSTREKEALSVVPLEYAKAPDVLA